MTLSSTLVSFIHMTSLPTSSLSQVTSYPSSCVSQTWRHFPRPCLFGQHNVVSHSRHQLVFPQADPVPRVSRGAQTGASTLTLPCFCQHITLEIVPTIMSFPATSLSFHKRSPYVKHQQAFRPERAPFPLLLAHSSGDSSQHNVVSHSGHQLVFRKRISYPEHLQAHRPERAPSPCLAPACT